MDTRYSSDVSSYVSGAGAQLQQSSTPKGDTSTQARQRPANGEVTEGNRPEGLSGRELGNMVDRVKDVVRSMQRDIDFSIHEETGETVVKVVDSETDEVIRQIPSEEMIELARDIEHIRGLLFDDEV